MELSGKKSCEMDFPVVFESAALEIAENTETFFPLLCLSHYW